MNLLMVGTAHKGMAFQGMAFPIAWTALLSGGSSDFQAQAEVLERFLEVVDPDSIKVVTADREFISVPWMKELKDRGIPFAIRLRSDRRIWESPDGPSLPARMYARTVAPGSERTLEGARYLSGAQEDGAEEVLVSVRVAIR